MWRLEYGQGQKCCRNKCSGVHTAHLPSAHGVNRQVKSEDGEEEVVKVGQQPVPELLVWADNVSRLNFMGPDSETRAQG